MARAASAQASRCRDADALEPAEGVPPRDQLAVSLPGSGEAATAEEPVLLVDNGGDVEIFVGVDVADDTAFRW